MADAGAEPQGIVRSHVDTARLSLQTEGEEHEPKISTPEIVLGYLWAIVLDACGYLVFLYGIGAVINDVPIVDAIGDSTFGFYLKYKGLPLAYQIPNWVAELVPGLGDVWPGYIIGWSLAIYVDRHPQTETAAMIQKISTLAGKKGVAGAAGKGAAAGRALSNVSGKVRTLPGMAENAARVVGQSQESDTESARATESIAAPSGPQRARAGSGLAGVPLRGPIAGGETYARREGEVIPGEQTLFETGPAFQEAPAPRPYRADTGVPSTAGTIQTGPVRAPDTTVPFPYREEGIYTPPPPGSRKEPEQLPLPLTSATRAGESSASSSAPTIPQDIGEAQPEGLVPSARETGQEEGIITSTSVPATVSASTSSEETRPEKPSASAPQAPVRAEVQSRDAATQQQAPEPAPPPVPVTSEVSIPTPRRRTRGTVDLSEAPAPQAERELTEYEKLLFETPVVEEVPEEARQPAPPSPPVPTVSSKPGATPSVQPRLEPLQAPPQPEQPSAGNVIPFRPRPSALPEQKAQEDEDEALPKAA